MAALCQDLRYALRGIRRAPLLACIVVLALTARIGLNTALFTIIEGMWLRAHVEKDPSNFVQLFAQYNSSQGGKGRFFSISVADYMAFHAETRTLSNLAA